MTAAFRESVNRSFPAVGPDSPDVVNVSGEPSQNMQRRPRRAGGPTNPYAPGTGTKRNRTGYQIKDANGPAPGRPLADFEVLRKRRRAAHEAAVDRAGEALAAPARGIHDAPVHGAHDAVQIVDDIGSRLRTEDSLNWLFRGPGAVT